MKIETATLNREVIVYSAPWCGGCKTVKSYLDNHNVEYREVDVSVDHEAMDELKSHGYNSIPVVAINSLDNSWADFNIERMNELTSNYPGSNEVF